MSPQPDDLLREVAESFAEVRHPGRDHIVEDARPANPEGRRIAEAFRERSWNEVPADALIGNRAALAFFTPEAFRYFLPAFIATAVNRYDEADTLPLEVVASLTPPAENDLRFLEQALALKPGGPESGFEPLMQFYRSGEAERRFLSRVSDFTPAQKKAIRHFLEYMRDAHGEDFAFAGPVAALERYWSGP